VRANGGRALLVLLLALLGLAGTPASAEGFAAQSASVALAPDNLALHHDLRDRLPRAARHALSTPLPDSWWAVYAHSARSWAQPGWSLAGIVTGTAVAVGVAVTPSTRAPPARVS
jgi:hypothetical protein